MCWTISWRLTLLGLSTLGPMTYMTILFSNWSRSQMTSMWKLRNELYNIMYSGFDNIKTVRSFGKEPQLLRYFRVLRKEQFKKNLY